MGKYINCGITTQIIVKSKINLKENKEKILNRINKVYDLKYYDVVFDKDDKNYMYLYLKEDLFNKKIKNLLKELVEIDLFRYSLYSNIEKIEEDYSDSDKEIKNKVNKYIENDNNFKIKKEYSKEFDYELRKEVINKNDYSYYLDDFRDWKHDELLTYNNYFYCTEMADDLLFNDDISRKDRNITINIKVIPFYYEIGKTDSEDICFVLRFLNMFLRTSLKSEIRSTLSFGLTW